jgi:hypothetical protein
MNRKRYTKALSRNFDEDAPGDLPPRFRQDHDKARPRGSAAMKTLRCTYGQVLTGETGAELYSAVEAHLAVHDGRSLEPCTDARQESPEPEQREEQ